MLSAPERTGDGSMPALEYLMLPQRGRGQSVCPTAECARPRVQLALGRLMQRQLLLWADNRSTFPFVLLQCLT